MPGVTLRFWHMNLEAPPGFEPGMEVLQTSALPLGDGADRKDVLRSAEHRIVPDAWGRINNASQTVTPNDAAAHAMKVEKDSRPNQQRLRPQARAGGKSPEPTP